MLSPAPGSTVAISPLVFSWTKSPAASGYFLHIGTTLGGKELFSQDVGNVTAYSITGLSTSSKTIYVRLWTHLDYWYSNDYAYTVTSTAAPATGNLTITFTPSAVTRDTSDNKFHYSVTLRETNGVGVTVTGMFIAGADYTSSIVDWFGSDAIGASGSAIVYVVSACAASPCNENRMWTFTGRDANGHTGLSWSAAVALGQ
jgi:hypothetical protein